MYEPLGVKRSSADKWRLRNWPIRLYWETRISQRTSDKLCLILTETTKPQRTNRPDSTRLRDRKACTAHAWGVGACALWLATKTSTSGWDDITWHFPLTPNRRQSNDQSRLTGQSRLRRVGSPSRQRRCYNLVRCEKSTDGNNIADSLWVKSIAHRCAISLTWIITFCLQLKYICENLRQQIYVKSH